MKIDCESADSLVFLVNGELVTTARHRRDYVKPQIVCRLSSAPVKHISVYTCIRPVTTIQVYFENHIISWLHYNRKKL